MHQHSSIPGETRFPRGTALAGFTLLELLLAVAIFALVLLAIHTVYSGALNLRNRTSAQIDHAIPLEHALETLRRDLAQLVPPGGTFSGAFQSALVTGAGLGPSTAATSNSFRAFVPGRIVSPELYTAANAVDDRYPWGEIARVTYYLADPTNQNSGRDLVRAVTRNLLPVTVDQPEHLRLLTGVEDMTFLFYDGLNWVQTWDSTAAATPLPGAVKVQLWLASTNATRITATPIELVVPILVQSSTNQTSTPTEGGT